MANDKQHNATQGYGSVPPDESYNRTTVGRTRQGKKRCQEIHLLGYAHAGQGVFAWDR